jgi:hypothetical protein
VAGGCVVAAVGIAGVGAVVTVIVVVIVAVVEGGLRVSCFVVPLSCV